MWAETFPNSERDAKRRAEQRKKNAKAIREEEERLAKMTPEEIEEMEKSIPEWKRNALVVADSEAQPEEKKGMFSGIKSRINQTGAAQSFYESEEYKKLREVRGNYSEFKDKFREGVENTQNPMVQRAVQLADLAYTESSCARAIKSMEAYDPYFAFEDLETEAADVFTEFYCNFLSGNLEFLEKVSGGVALAICKAELQRRQKEGWVNRYDEMLDCTVATFNSGQMDQLPSFTFIMEITEINC